MSHDIFSAFSSEELQSAIGSKLFRGMLDTMPVAVAVLKAIRDKQDAITGFIYTFANKTAERINGQPLAGKHFSLNNDAPLFKHMVAAADTGKREDFLYHYQKAPEKWIHYSVSRFGDGVMLTYENVTERKKAALALQRERTRMAHAQAISNTGSFEWEVTSGRIYWSDEMFRIHGIEPQSEEITLDKAYSLVHPDDVKRIREKIEHYRQMSGREEIHCRLKLPNGEIRHARVWLESFSENGKIVRISGLTQNITDKKVAEEKLRKQSDEKKKREAILEDYGRIIESVHDAIISVDTKGRIVTWNGGAEKMYGYRATEAVGKKLSNLIVPEEKRKELAEVFAKVFKGENIIGLRTSKKRKDKSIIDVVVNIVSLKDASGKVTGAAATSKNINQAEIAGLREELAKKTEDKYRTLFEAMDEGFCIIELIRDENGLVTDFIYREVNEAFIRLTGFENPIGKAISELLPDIEQYWVDAYANVAETGNSVRLENYVQGIGRWYSIHVSRIGGQDSRLVAVVFNDITQIKLSQDKAQNQITEQNKFIQSMINATPDIMFVMDINTKKILFATRNIAQEMGYTADQIERMKEPFFDIMHPDDRKAMIRHIDDLKTAADGEVREIRYRMIHADGNAHWFIDRNTVFKRDGEGVPYEKLGITHDIHARVNADEEIHLLNRSLTEKNRELRALANELKTFASVAAYDYKDTLQTLYTNLEFIISRDAQNLSNAGKANLRKAQTAIQKMKLLTDDIVEFSKIRTPDENPSMVDLNETVSNALDELSEKISLAAPDIEKEKLPEIKGYPFLLDLLFYHLLDNAVKFRNPDEKLKITISHAMSKDKHSGHDVHSISIADNGIGFKQEESGKIFEMFYRIHDKKYKGSGIGLAICKKIADLHGGTMAVESEPGKGTTICCFFPTM